MEKMFKRSVLGAAVALAAVSGSANAAIELAGDAVQLYGQAAGFIHLTNPKASGKDGAAQAVIESRVGFRGRVAYDEFGPDFIWQIEGGNADNSDKSGQLGARDTYLGLDFEGVGSFKYGRQLVAAYNYVDWPHSNPGLGNVFDWHNKIGASYEDRADNVFRFDSANFGGFNFQATLSGMGSSTEEMVSSIAASYSQDMFSVHAGYYDQKGYNKTVATEGGYVADEDGNPKWEAPTSKVEKAGDVSYSIIGGSVFLGDLTLTAAWKAMENGVTNNDQDAYSATAQYVIDGTWVLKGGYAATSESKLGTDDDSQAITGRLGYLLPSTYLFLDVRSYDYNGSDETDDGTNILIGAEYYF
ncbi:porin [Grimontia hollisae]|uniref:Porin OmpF n=1 Tax=Grimontia hollisae TaxID=673 RepID=A0A377HKS1_GRIHO|nr:porin [Grimontia hollisae]MDF2185596.1 porin [Grimontia hollisae]STO56767.1 Porin OmpF [Grimontia hollisae]STQ74623.1 Porin OmpF [Grimontia hollisae]